jgi:DNA polymerase-3 subunit beta
MQLVKTQRDTLLRPLQIVSGIVERRHTLPILANILIRKDGEKCLSCPPTSKCRSPRTPTSAPARVTATTVAARKLLDILRALPDSGEVSVSCPTSA